MYYAPIAPSLKAPGFKLPVKTAAICRMTGVVCVNVNAFVTLADFLAHSVYFRVLLVAHTS